MENSKRFELSAEGMDTEYYYSAPDSQALFGPLALKSMYFIFLAMLILFALALMVSMPITIIPFALGFFIFNKYRKVKKLRPAKKLKSRS